MKKIKDIDMRKKESKAGSILGTFIVGLIVASLIGNNGLGLFNQIRFTKAQYSPVTSSGTVPEEILKGSEPIGHCTDESLLSGVHVLIVDDLGGGTDGIFYGGSYTIAIDTVNINVISHEVSHLVDKIVEAKGIKDGETRAYLAGFYTQCIVELIQSRDYTNTVVINNK